MIKSMNSQHDSYFSRIRMEKQKLSISTLPKKKIIFKEKQHKTTITKHSTIEMLV